MFENYEDVVTLEMMCEMLHIGKAAAYDLLKSGKIKNIKNGNRYLIPKKAIIEFINSLWKK